MKIVFLLLKKLYDFWLILSALKEILGKKLKNLQFVSYSKVFSWREAHSSTGRLVTGGTEARMHGTEQKTKLSITRLIF